jgi:hypothetical protein
MTFSIAEAMTDPELFEPFFRGPSWALWRSVLKAAFALTMTKKEVELFRSVADRDPPKKRVRELWCIAGRRSGKDSIASAIATYFSGFVDYSGRLRPGEPAAILCLAVDKQQATIVARYTKALFDRVPLLKGMVERETASGLDLSTGAELSIIASNFRSVRGRSIGLAILDEIAYWRSEDSATPDTETLSAIIPGLSTLGGMIVGISSPYRRSGVLYERWRDHYGKDGDILVVKGPTSAFNPTIDQRIIDEELIRDPQVAKAEWLSEWRDDLATYLPRELVESAVDRGVVVRPPIPGVEYRAFADPSGGVSDSFTLAIGHSEAELCYLDCLVEIVAPFDPGVATEAMAATLKAYGLHEVTGDHFSAQWVVSAFAKASIQYKHSELDRSTIYANALPLFTSGRARILDNRRLIGQIAQLERRAMPGGKDKIDHPRGMKDDASNSAMGVLVQVSAGGSAEILTQWQRAFGSVPDDDAPPAALPAHRNPDVRPEHLMPCRWHDRRREWVAVDERCNYIG